MKENWDFFSFLYSSTISSAILQRSNQEFHSLVSKEERNLSTANLAPLSNLHWPIAQGFCYLLNSFCINLHFLWARGYLLCRKSTSTRNEREQVESGGASQLFEMFSFMTIQAFMRIAFSSIDHNIKHFPKEVFHRRFSLIRNRT